MKLLLTSSAVRDLRWFRRYYASIFPEGAAHARASYAAATRLVLEHPEAGRPLASDFREWQIARTPFSLIYRIEPRIIRIARIWDGRSDPVERS